jgi:hypothetical protein
MSQKLIEDAHLYKAPYFSTVQIYKLQHHPPTAQFTGASVSRPGASQPRHVNLNVTIAMDGVIFNPLAQ